MVTIFNMRRDHLITMEAMEKYSKGEEFPKDSVNDDLESFFDDIRLGHKPNKFVRTYFLPQLTDEEMELVENKDESYLQIYSFKDPLKREGKEMKASDSKFVQGWSERKTFTLENLFEI